MKKSPQSTVHSPQPIRIDAEGLHYRVLNERIRQAVNSGVQEIILDNVCGQRYIGNGIKGEDIKITVNGTAGNDLAAFMDGPKIFINGNAQDGTGNTMNAGEIVIYGDAGDIVGHSMRGGRIFIRGEAGYRVGIHMKAYEDMFPVVIIGKSVRDFFGEYMAGGLLIVLGLEPKRMLHANKIVGDFIGTGMHGGAIVIRGEVDESRLGKEVKIAEPDRGDKALLRKHLTDYCRYFDLNLEEILKEPFIKLYPYSHRPYGRLYAY